jgi:hypothetical protein
MGQPLLLASQACGVFIVVEERERREVENV